MTEIGSSHRIAPQMTADSIKSAAEPKNVSDFCKDCSPYDCMRLYSPGFHNSVFIDREGLMWVCGGWKYCDHAIILNDKIHSCRVRSRQIKDDERGRTG